MVAPSPNTIGFMAASPASGLRVTGVPSPVVLVPSDSRDGPSMMVVGVVGDRTVVGRPNDIPLPARTFQSTNPNAKITLEATFADGSPLSDWLKLAPSPAIRRSSFKAPLHHGGGPQRQGEEPDRPPRMQGKGAGHERDGLRRETWRSAPPEWPGSRNREGIHAATWRNRYAAFRCDRVSLEVQRETGHGQRTMMSPFRHFRTLLRAGRVHAGSPAPDLVA